MIGIERQPLGPGFPLSRSSDTPHHRQKDRRKHWLIKSLRLGRSRGSRELRKMAFDRWSRLRIFPKDEGVELASCDDTRANIPPRH